PFDDLALLVHADDRAQRRVQHRANTRLVPSAVDELALDPTDQRVEVSGQACDLRGPRHRDRLGRRGIARRADRTIQRVDRSAVGRTKSNWCGTPMRAATVVPRSARSAKPATTPRSPAGAALTTLMRPVRGSTTGATSTGPRSESGSQAAPLYETPVGAGPALEQLMVPLGVMNSRCVFWKTLTAPNATLQGVPGTKTAAIAGFAAVRATVVSSCVNAAAPSEPARSAPNCVSPRVVSSASCCAWARTTSAAPAAV